VVIEGAWVATHRIDPLLLEAMDRLRPGDRHVAVTVVLRDDLRPSPPWTSAKFRRTRHLIDDLLGRVTDAVGPRSIDHLDVWRDAIRGAFIVHARVSFVERLLLQPEVGECLYDIPLFDIPEKAAETDQRAVE
jgi:hypothetical protein